VSTRGNARAAQLKRWGAGYTVVLPLLFLTATLFLAWAYTVSFPRGREELVWMTGHLERWEFFEEPSSSEYGGPGVPVLTIYLAEYRTPVRASHPIGARFKFDQFMREVATRDLVRFAVEQRAGRWLEAERDELPRHSNPRPPVTVWALATPRANYLSATEALASGRGNGRVLLGILAFVIACDLAWVLSIICAPEAVAWFRRRAIPSRRVP
jgi:hypothetical protein